LQSKAVAHNTTHKQYLTALESFVLGMVARTLATLAVFPFLRAKVVLQSQSSAASSSSHTTNGTTASTATTTSPPPPSLMPLLRHLWQQQGLAGLYQGIGPELTRGIFSAAFMLMIKEQLAQVVRAWLVSSHVHAPKHYPRLAPRPRRLTRSGR
jgi:hypothetical protein